MRRALRSSWFMVACACSGGSSGAAPQPVTAAPADAATLQAAPTQPEAPSFVNTPKRPGRPIEIILRSTPSGARVAVDGVELGVTPTMWMGETGAPHEFTFVLAGHALARYRFVPVASGLVHPRLEPVAEPVNAPRPPPPQMVAPQPAPSTVMQPEPPLSAPPSDAPTAPNPKEPGPTAPGPMPPMAAPSPPVTPAPAMPPDAASAPTGSGS